MWWYISLQDEIVEQTLLHLPNNQDETSISINCLEYVTKIINYCAAITVLLESHTYCEPHPVVLCITDNISAKNWTLHTSKKSMIGCAGSAIGINAKWISTVANKIADKILRIKNSNTPFSLHYDFSKLQQDHVELKHCCFF